MAVSTLLEIAMKEHIPRKNARAMFSINVLFMNKAR
jgi:hypothetical protein